MPELASLYSLQNELNLTAVLARIFLEGDVSAYKQIIELSKEDNYSKFTGIPAPTRPA
jgi:hypothetical protein